MEESTLGKIPGTFPPSFSVTKLMYEETTPSLSRAMGSFFLVFGLISK